MSCCEQEQEQLVNTASPLLPELPVSLYKFFLLASSQQQSRDALGTAISGCFVIIR